MSKLIFLFIGTKAQFIKMAPVCLYMDQAKIDYMIVDLCQHGSITSEIVNDFGVAGPVLSLLKNKKVTENYAQVASWVLKCLIVIAKGRATHSIFEQYRNNATVLIHGDTLSTLIGYYLAKRMGYDVGLVEAGLTSYNYFEPFPEEAIRRHVEARSDYLFITNAMFMERLQKKKKRSATIVNIEYNTGRDALLYMISNAKPYYGGEYSVFTLHRAETLASKARLFTIISYIISMTQYVGEIKFFIHAPTLYALKKFGLMQMIENCKSIKVNGLLRYREFSGQIYNAKYIFTDGGSVQEEASYLQKACLILRKRTERNDGVGANAKIASFDIFEDFRFLQQASEIEASAPFSNKPTYLSSSIILDSLGFSREAP